MSRNHRVLANSRRWQRVRRRVLARDNWRCQECKGYGNECDHVVPLHKGGAVYDLANLQCLCVSCHIQKTRGENCRPPTVEETKWREFVANIAEGA